MAQITINNWLGGLSPSDRLGKENSYYQGDCADPGREVGYLLPAREESEIAASDDTPAIVSNNFHSAVLDSVNKNIYYIGSTKLQQSSDSFSFTNDSDFPHTIGDDLTGHADHVTFRGEDAVIYPIGTTNYLFYSWNDYTDGDVGRVALTGSLTFEDDNLSNTIANGDVLTNNPISGENTPHPMLKWEESGKLLIANGNGIVSIDGQTGADGTADMDAFNLPQGWVITALFSAGDLVGICAFYAGGWPFNASETAVFFWDGSSGKWTRKVPVPDKRITAAKSLGGDLYIFGPQKNSSYGNIRKWDGSGFSLVQQIKSSYGYPYKYGGVDTYRHGLIINTHKGDLFYYGQPEAGLPFALYNIAPNNGSSYGVIAPAGRDTIIRSYREPEGGPFNWVEITGDSYNTNFLYKSLYYEFPQKARINFVRVYFQTLESGADDDIKIESDYGNTTTTLGSISYANDGAIEHKRFNKVIPCHNFRVVIDTDEDNSTTGIKYAKIVVDYDLIDSAD